MSTKQVSDYLCVMLKKLSIQPSCLAIRDFVLFQEESHLLCTGAPALPEPFHYQENVLSNLQVLHLHYFRVA